MVEEQETALMFGMGVSHRNQLQKSLSNFKQVKVTVTYCGGVGHHRKHNNPQGCHSTSKAEELAIQFIIALKEKQLHQVMNGKERFVWGSHAPSAIKNQHERSD